MAVTHPGEVALPVAPEHTSRRGRRLAFAGIGLLVVVGLLALAAVAAWVGYEAAHEGAIFRGVSVAGVDLSGRTPAEAETALATALADRFDGRLIVTVGSTRTMPTYASLGRSTDVAATVSAAMAVGREGTLVERLQGRVRSATDGATVSPVVAFHPAALETWVQTLGTTLDRPAVPAGIVFTTKQFRVTADELGVRLDRADLTRRLAAMLADPTMAPRVRTRGHLLPVTADYTDIDAGSTTTALRRITKPIELALGEKTWTIRSGRIRGWIDLVPSRSGPVPVIDARAVAASLPKAIAKAAKRAPVETMFLVTRAGKRIGFVSGRPGQRLDTRRTVGAIVGSLSARQAGAAVSNEPLKVVITRVALELTPEEAGKVVPEMDRIGTWTTYYQVSERNGFGANITIPARIIDRTLVRPGQIFDFWGTIGPVTYARGFRDGAIIVGGRSQPTGAIAGGICSVSTTLFNAAARAGLQIVERDNHYYYISRYPLGLDATVSKKGGRIVQNMRFRNDTDYDIFIRGSAGPGWIRFDIYSLPNGRQVSFTKPKVWNVVPAHDSVVRTSNLPRGRSERIEYPVNGMQVLVTRTVRENGRILHRDDFYTNYGRVDGILQVGTG